MSRKTSPVADKDVGRTEHVNFLRDEARASSYLLAYGITTTSTLQILINAGVTYFAGTRVEFAGGYSPMMTEPTASSRIDVVSMASSAEIVVTVGTEADTPTAPDYPTDNTPICEVYHKAGEVKITNEDEEEGEGYISKDLRKFFRHQPLIKVIRKTADESVSYSATLQDDDHLFFDITANEVWYVEYILFGHGTADADFKFSVTVPGGATGKWWDLAEANAIVALGSITGTAFGTAKVIDAHDADRYILLYAYIFNAGNAGQVKLQFTSNSAAKAGPQTLYTNSFLKATRIR